MKTLDPPPLLPDVDEVLKDYIVNPENLPIHQYERHQEFWPRKPDATSLLHFDTSPASTTLKVRANALVTYFSSDAPEKD